jgi:outer membrane protein assembly factor BamA
MRAWGLRKLGPGSTVKDFKGTGSTPERYGDIQLEGNLEYRFPFFTMGAMKVNGAVFTDVGNIWFMKKAPTDLESEVFKFSRALHDLAVGVGAGLRLDFGFFVVRMDYSYKAKDPSPNLTNASKQNKLFAYKFFDGSQFQIGLSYPFIL